MMISVIDAWKQMHDLREKFSKCWKVRPDIEVQALACERGINLILWERGVREPLQMRSYRDTGIRNVSTMRELAQAINDACDFVEQSNPEWAKLP